MFTTSSLLQLPATLKAYTSPFLHVSPSRHSLFPSSSKRTSPSPHRSPTSLPLTVRAMKNLQGRVVCAANDKTVAVEAVRLAPHPKYKRRVRKKKTYQAHDPANQFKVGDLVQLEKSRPISKIKTFLAVPVTSKNTAKPVEAVPQDLGLPLESQTQ